jgi:hypothetical protein
MTRIVRKTLGDPISAETRAELARLAEKGNAHVNTDDIPETTPEQWRRARMPNLQTARKTTLQPDGLRKAG